MGDQFQYDSITLIQMYISILGFIANLHNSTVHKNSRKY